MAITSSLETASTLPPPTEQPEQQDNEQPLEEGTYTSEPTERDHTDSLKQFLVDQIDDINLARHVDHMTLQELGQTVVKEYDIDENSRSEWKTDADQAMRFATQKTEPKQFPWPNASSVIFPLIMQAALQFNARTYPAIINNRNVVKGVIWGSDKGTPATQDGKPDSPPLTHPDGTPVWLSPPGSKRLRADRIGEHMSWQLLDDMKEWESQTDSLLMQIPIMGGMARKTYRDHATNKNKSLAVSLKHLVWNYHATSFEAAPRHTEILTLYPYQIQEKERAGEFLPMIYGPGGSEGDVNPEQAQSGDPNAPHVFLEQHRRWDLDDDGYPEPYVVTVHKRSAKVVRIVARYDEDGIEVGEGLPIPEEQDGGMDVVRQKQTAEQPTQEIILRVKPVEHYTLYPFLPNPDGGSYPAGFGHLLRSISESINTTLNQMFDAGTLQNAGGGFVSDQLSIHSGPVNFQVGKYVRVGSKGQSIRDAVFPIPFPGPSTVLFQLLGLLISAGKETAGTQEILAGDAAVANAPPTTILALIEQGIKIYTAIHKRVYRALKCELDKLYRLNRLYLDKSERFQVGDEWKEVTEEDYRLGGGAEPAADPTMITDMQKLGRAQILMGMAADPLLNKKEIYTRLFDAANVDHIDQLWAPPPPPQLLQMQMEQASAQLGRVRAAELKDNTQAFLNMAMARAKASGPQMDWIDKQLDILRLHIEAVNTTVKAADVEAKSRGRVQTGDSKALAKVYANQPISAPPPDQSLAIPAPNLAPPPPSPTSFNVNGGAPPLPNVPPVNQ